MEVTWPSLGVLIPFKDITFIFFFFPLFWEIGGLGGGGTDALLFENVD